MKSAHDRGEIECGAKIEIDMVRALYESGLDHNAHRSVIHFVNAQMGYESQERLEHILNQVVVVDGIYRIGVKS